jgi:hypothetical protein
VVLVFPWPITVDSSGKLKFLEICGVSFPYPPLAGQFGGFA